MRNRLEFKCVRDRFFKDREWCYRRFYVSMNVLECFRVLCYVYGLFEDG